VRAAAAAAAVNADSAPGSWPAGSWPRSQRVSVSAGGAAAGAAAGAGSGASAPPAPGSGRSSEKRRGEGRAVGEGLRGARGEPRDVAALGDPSLPALSIASSVASAAARSGSRPARQGGEQLRARVLANRVLPTCRSRALGLRLRDSESTVPEPQR